MGTHPEEGRTRTHGDRPRLFTKADGPQLPGCRRSEVAKPGGQTPTSQTGKPRPGNKNQHAADTKHRDWCLTALTHFVSTTTLRRAPCHPSDEQPRQGDQSPLRWRTLGWPVPAGCSLVIPSPGTRTPDPLTTQTGPSRTSAPRFSACSREELLGAGRWAEPGALRGGRPAPGALRGAHSPARWHSWSPVRWRLRPPLLAAFRRLLRRRHPPPAPSALGLATGPFPWETRCCRPQAPRRVRGRGDRDRELEHSCCQPSLVALPGDSPLSVLGTTVAVPALGVPAPRLQPGALQCLAFLF